MLNSLISIASKQLRSCLFSQNSNFRALGVVYNGVVNGSEKYKSAVVREQQTRWLRSSCCLLKDSVPKILQKPDDGAIGEKSHDIDHASRLKSALFPDENTPSLLFDGVPFDKLSVIYVKVSKNNTLIQLMDEKGRTLLYRTCGLEGFKNAKKGTNVAAQATAIALGMKAVNLGVLNVRVKIRGLGPGRAASIKGLQMAGMNIVSITDNTPVDVNCPRPRKVRRL